MRAYAKINVGLWIKERRDDGYHELETIILPIDLYDEISLKKAERLQIIGKHFGEEDLMVKAYRLLESIYGALPVEIHIKKHIPIAAGLAGGTADGAAVLTGICDLYELEISGDTLTEKSLALGADFPYCIYGKACVAKGIGEVLFPIEVPSYHVLLLNPGFSVSTKDAYGMWTNFGSGGSLRKTVEHLKEGTLAQLKNTVINDLYYEVAKKHVEIDDMIAALYEAGAEFAHMSGSGPTVYGLFKKEREIQRAYAILKDKYEIVIKTRTSEK